MMWAFSWLRVLLRVPSTLYRGVTALLFEAALKKILHSISLERKSKILQDGKWGRFH